MNLFKAESGTGHALAVSRRTASCRMRGALPATAISTCRARPTDPSWPTRSSTYDRRGRRTGDLPASSGDGERDSPGRNGVWTVRTRGRLRGGRRSRGVVFRPCRSASPLPDRRCGRGRHPKFVLDPWARDALDGDRTRRTRCSSSGTGLTMADVVVSLLDRGHRGADLCSVAAWAFCRARTASS